MIRFTLEGQTEKLAPHGTFPDTLTRRPLYHQVQTWDAWKTHTAVLNTYNTGVGKTIASLLPLLDIDAENRPNKQRNVLFIAPTNALIAQHTDDIKDFVREHNLNFHVFSARADDIKRVRGGLRPGETLQRYITNYPEFERTEQERRSIVMVTNPDIFYYALYFQYGAHDRRNVFKAFLMRFDYLIIDEFHYYDNKQLAAFLFAFLIFKEWGYFDAGRRVCLLSATPRPNVRRYLEGLFGEQLAEVSPQNEPETTAEYDTLPALTPLEVTVITDTLEDWLENTGADTLRQWLDDDLDGAIISNSLGRINRAYARLKNRVDSIEMGRITGPEPQEQRSQATARKLILATPTVDIGYNFAKHNKSRQNIDFVVCEARFQDDLVQRIGRAGRVLGKDIIDKTSQAIVLLPDDAAHEFRALDGQTLNRRDFAEWLNNREHLTSKHALEAYIRKYAALELAYPLYQLEFMLAGDDRHELDTIYERACELFGVAYPQARWGLKKQFQRQERRMAWLREAESANKHTPPSKTAEHLADYLAFAHPEVGRVEPNDLSPEHIKVGWKKYRNDIIQFVKGKVECTKAIYNFRDAFSGPTAVVYDPHAEFSTEVVNQYDIFHFLRNYEFEVVHDKKAFRQIVPSEYAIPDGDFYLLLKRQREKSANIAFTLMAPEYDRETFDSRWIRKPMALCGYGLEFSKNEDAVPLEVVTHLREQFIVGMILPPEDQRVVHARFRGTDLIAWPLRVNFGDGTSNDDYRFFAGTSAFVAHAELEGYIRYRERQDNTSIIT